ncbi:DNA-binding MarR family transcriptional regulator [Actinorugispora endophytica]|uniref:DNA-binding MarR family transcriptional regulator n=2 Tax=Actinorugispora endophytica TaxID=1605990 RepID=A0A4R6UTM5_9ACTN|nr:DNA-binding MarR family transcriptional regulator [Actinorugispora endophytica]
MGDGASEGKRELVERLQELELRQVRMFARSRSLPLLSTTLTIQQLKVLVVLSIDGDMPTHELAERVGTGVATLTGIVDRLAARTLVYRREDPSDRRVRRVDLTDEGYALIGDLWGVGQQRNRAALSTLDIDTLRALAKGLEALCDALEKTADTSESPEEP